MAINSFIFNQYYIDLLKRLKSVSKKDKSTPTSRSILKSIRENYITLDKSSDEYLVFINNNISQDAWDKFVTSPGVPPEESYDWFKDNADCYLYDGIKIGEITTLLNDDYLCNHFLSVFYIFRKELDETTTTKIVKILQTVDTKDLDVDDEDIKKVIVKLQEMRNKKIKDTSGIDMKGIEDTTLGKLAKEILEDIDIGKLQKSMGEKGDVLKAIGDPDSGFADIITNVSKKMATKISNGELKQENLIQDALKFASIMPNMFGGGAGGMGGSRGANQRGGGNDMPDMSNIMSMMSSWEIYKRTALELLKILDAF